MLLELQLAIKEECERLSFKPGSDEYEAMHECVVGFDGMGIKDGVVTNRYGGDVTGIQEMADLVDFSKSKLKMWEESELKLAKECMQLMATTLDGKFRVPFAYYLLKTATTGIITEMVDQAIVSLDKIGLCVRVVVCDGASFHRAWQESVLEFTDESGIWGGDANAKSFKVAMKHPLYPDRADRRIFVISDPVHLIKKAVENLHSSGDTPKHTKRLSRGGERLNWDIFKQAWHADQVQPPGAWLAPKVTRDHIERTSFTRLKTKFSTQLLSRSMQRCVKAYTHAQPVTQMLRYMELFDNYIDIMNSGRWRREWSGNREYLTTPITDMKDRRISELISMVQWFDGWFEENEELPANTPADKKERFISRELYFDIRLAIRGFVAFCGHQLKARPGSPIIPRLYNQDCVEGYFGMMRASGGEETHMTALSIEHSQAAAWVQTGHGGMLPKSSSGTANSNVTADHNAVDQRQIVAKTGTVVKREIAESQQRGRDLAKRFKIKITDD